MSQGRICFTAGLATLGAALTGGISAIFAQTNTGELDQVISAGIAGAIMGAVLGATAGRFVGNHVASMREEEANLNKALLKDATPWITVAVSKDAVSPTPMIVCTQQS
jgi:hypothetical protein